MKSCVAFSIHFRKMGSIILHNFLYLLAILVTILISTQGKNIPTTTSSTATTTSNSRISTSTIQPANIPSIISNGSSTVAPNQNSTAEITTKIPGSTGKNGTSNESSTSTNSPEIPWKMEQLKVELVPNGRLHMEIKVSEENIGFQILINLTDWAWWEYKNGNSSGNKQLRNETSLKTFLLGFESGQSKNMDLDVVAISLAGDEDKDSQIKDSHWSKNDKILVPDSSQNYELLSLDVGKNRTIFSIKFSRNFTTCDDNDFHLSNLPLRIWWLLDSQSITPTLESMKPKLSQQIEEKTTPSSKTEITTTAIPGSATSTKLPISNSTEKPTNDSKVVSTEKSRVNVRIDESDQNVTDVEVLRSLKYNEFNGPLTLTMKELLNNFSFVVIMTCGGSRTSKMTYRCSIAEMQDRIFLGSMFQITRGILRTTEIRKSGLKFHGHDTDFCPSNEIIHGNSSIANALTGKHQGKNGKGRAASDFHSKSLIRHFSSFFFAFFVFVNYLI